MYLLVNIFGVAIFILVAFAFSKKKREVNWKSIAIMVVINLFLAWFLTKFSLGRDLVEGAANGFNWLMQAAYQGIQFMVPAMPKVTDMGFFMSVLLPVIMIVPLFDILTYIGVLPFIIKWIGRGLSKITGQPKFESFFSVEMMFLGNTEALAVSSLQLKLMKSERNLTLAMMSMSCVTASIIGAYTTMMPGQYILTAVPINIINAIIITSILNPVEVTEEEDTIAEMTGSNSNDLETSESDSKREPFFAFLGDSILGAGKLVLIIAANVIAFVALAALIDNILGLVNPNLSLENILGIIMFPFAWLMGFNPSDAFELARYMGTKLVTNEFVVMGQVSSTINSFAPHYKAVLTVFVTSFANFSTIGMIIGCFKGIVDKEKNDVIARNVGYMLLSGILVSLLSAGMVGVFVW